MSKLPPGWIKISNDQVKAPNGELYTQKIPKEWTVDKATKKVMDPDGNTYSSLMDLIHGIRRYEQKMLGG